MFSKAKVGVLVGIIAATVGVGCLGSAYAATTATTPVAKETITKKEFKGTWGDKKGFFVHKFGKGFSPFNNEELLKLFNLDEAKLHEELRVGKTLADIAKAQGVTEERVVDVLSKYLEEELAAAVKAGKLTEEQTDKMKEKSKEMLQYLVEGRRPAFEKTTELSKN